MFQDANTFVPNNAKVEGVCKDGDAETLVLSFKEFSLEWAFLKVNLHTVRKPAVYLTPLVVGIDLSVA